MFAWRCSLYFIYSIAITDLPLRFRRPEFRSWLADLSWSPAPSLSHIHVHTSMGYFFHFRWNDHTFVSQAKNDLNFALTNLTFVIEDI